MKTISDKLEELVWILRFGRPKKKITAEMLLAHLDLIKSPVFFLSTGRCGTKWFSELLAQDSNIRVLHSPTPSFSIQNAFLYDLWKNADVSIRDRMTIGENLFTTGREQHLRYFYKCDKRYIETNNHITFFAPVLAEIFPDSKFVHLYRHPGEFVRSGVRRGWFDHNKDATVKIIQPSDTLDWNSYNQVQKIAWVWNETNQFIEDFKSGLNPDRIINFNFNDKNANSIDELLRFIQVKVSPDKLNSRVNKPINQQNTGSFPNYNDWTQESKDELKAICGSLAKKYHYDL